MIKSLGIIFGCLLLGDVISGVLYLPIPGNVIGMLLLTLALTRHLVRLEDVKPTADLLVKNLAELRTHLNSHLPRHLESGFTIRQSRRGDRRTSLTI